MLFLCSVVISWEDRTKITFWFLKLRKDKKSEFLFGSSEDGVEPFPITGVILDGDGDVCLESDDGIEYGLSATELVEAVSYNAK